MEAGGGWGCARDKDEVVSPEEHLYTANDRATPLYGSRLVSSLVGHKPTAMKKGLEYYVHRLDFEDLCI